MSEPLRLRALPTELHTPLDHPVDADARTGLIMEKRGEQGD
ncbi:hypothetical protein AB9Q10_34595 [Streptomyces krungchingensis]